MIGGTLSILAGLTLVICAYSLFEKWAESRRR